MKLFKTWGMERRSVTKVLRALSKASSPYNLGFQLSISKKRNILNPTKQLWTYPHVHICTWLQKTKLSWVHHAWNQVETWKLRNSHKSHIAQLSASRSKWRFLLVWVGTSGPWQPGQEERCQSIVYFHFWCYLNVQNAIPIWTDNVAGLPEIICGVPNPTLKIPEEQDPIGRANVELKSLASILYELRKQLQYGSGDLNFAFLYYHLKVAVRGTCGSWYQISTALCMIGVYVG